MTLDSPQNGPLAVNRIGMEPTTAPYFARLGPLDGWALVVSANTAGWFVSARQPGDSGSVHEVPESARKPINAWRCPWRFTTYRGP